MGAGRKEYRLSRLTLRFEIQRKHFSKSVANVDSPTVTMNRYDNLLALGAVHIWIQS